MKRPTKCVHYTGTANDRCAAGVKYADVQLGYGTPQYSLPCFAPQAGVTEGRDWNPLGATCEKCRLPTPEELAAEEAAMKLRWEGIGKARAAIVAACGGPWKRGTPGREGRIDCPACGRPKALAFSRAGYNGHVHARCATAGCVAWME